MRDTESVVCIGAPDEAAHLREVALRFHRLNIAPLSALHVNAVPRRIEQCVVGKGDRARPGYRITMANGSGDDVEHVLLDIEENIITRSTLGNKLQHAGFTWYIALCGQNLGADVTGIVDNVTCPKCLAAFDRALELGFKGAKSVWYYPRGKSFVASWTKKNVPREKRALAKPGRYFRPSAMRMWLEANGRTLTDLHRGEV
jgi:hypothetical protein